MGAALASLTLLKLMMVQLCCLDGELTRLPQLLSHSQAA